MQFAQSRRRAAGLSISGLLCTAVLSAATLARAESVTVLDCAAELDAAVAMASNPDHAPGTLENRFAALERACPAFAQMAHNQGVLAAREDRWPQAIAHFERALSKDKRAADTHQHLQQIFKFRAAEAYAQALDRPLNVQPPTPMLQDSSKRNAESLQNFPAHDRLRNMATVEYELYAWWHARQNWKGIRDYYVDGFDIEAIKLTRQEHINRQWADTRREIAFTENDVAIVLGDSDKPHTLLLMRLVGSRWKIYQETFL